MPQATSSMRSCRCGSTNHLRTTHRDCPLNTISPYVQPQTVPCPSCGSFEHRRSNHRNCPNNTSNTSVNVVNHEQSESNTTLSNIQNVPRSRRNACRNCPSCGSNTHSRASHHECPFNTEQTRNTTNEITPTISQYRVARMIPFNPENIIGPNISLTEGNLYRRHVFPRMESRCPFCNAHMWVDERLKASSIQNPRFRLCCSNGKITLPLPFTPPQELLDFVTNHYARNEQCVNFHTNIRAFNNAFAFVSIKANVDENLASGRNGVSTFRVNGTMYHNVGALRAQNETSAGFSLIYFSDTNEQLALQKNVRFPDVIVSEIPRQINKKS
ncbi:hypothetical protein INT47_005971 [Mucor saturninus]|uniref:Uncharacterized protein n=1 Tax=Mucor saturninus TaxID=64648 RepID=A0A8H7QI20_9FUNG|nr:hypothetical protein INT47_005971 [Mucor saturninus]